MIPQIQATNVSSATPTTQIEIVQQPSKTYKDDGTKISGIITSIDAIRQAVRYILNIERYAYVIYPDSFGMELEKYKGQPFEYLQATIQKDLFEALTQDDRIYNVVVTDIVKENIDSASVVFDVYSTEGILENERIKINV